MCENVTFESYSVLIKLLNVKQTNESSDLSISIITLYLYEIFGEQILNIWCLFFISCWILLFYCDIYRKIVYFNEILSTCATLHSLSYLLTKFVSYAKFESTIDFSQLNIKAFQKLWLSTTIEFYYTSWTFWVFIILLSDVSFAKCKKLKPIVRK
jgi:hypothetical protein